MQRPDLPFVNPIGPVQPILGLDILMFILAIVGLVLNGCLLFITIWRRRTPWAIDTTLITIISLFDEILAGFVAGGLLLRLFEGNSILSSTSMWCSASATIFGGATIVTLVFTALLAVVRYRCIVYGIKVNTRTWSIISIIILLFYIILFGLSAKYSNKYLLPSGLYCSPQFWSDKPLVKVYGSTIITSFAFSIVSIPFCYSSITIHYHCLMAKMDQAKLDYKPSFLRSTTFKLIIVISAYILVIIPKFLLVFLTIYEILPKISLLDGIVINFLFSITSVNALFALLMHEDTRQEFFTLIGLRRFHLESIHLRDRESVY